MVRILFFKNTQTTFQYIWWQAKVLATSHIKVLIATFIVYMVNALQGYNNNWGVNAKYIKWSLLSCAGHATIVLGENSKKSKKLELNQDYSKWQNKKKNPLCTRKNLIA